ncbi:hypothetical protein NG2371_04258 [Nocardia gamkensis]|nr:hypothetical protein [Nocardia gamkensis]
MAVTVTSPTARDMPKSVILTVPSSATSRFAGFTSRCMIPASCAAARALAACAPISATSIGGSVRLPDSLVARLGASMYSMTNQGWPSSSATSNTVMAFGWCSRAAIRPSRMARRFASSAADPDRPGPSNTCLTATARCNRTSVARQTTPMAPVPIGSVSRYRPAINRSAVMVVCLSYSRA